MALPVATANLNDYERLALYHKAIRQRKLATGRFFYWPNGSQFWESGTVPAGITETTFTDASKSGTWDTSKDDPWDAMNRDTPDTLSIPNSWILVIEAPCGNDPTETVITPITGITDAGQLTYSNIRDFVTGGWIASIAALEGRQYKILSADTGDWWTQGIFQRPNNREWAKGEVIEYFDDPDFPLVATNPTNSSIKDAAPGRGWRAAEIVGKKLRLLATDADGTLLREVTVTAADDETKIIEFAAQAWTPDVGGSPYIVVAAGAKADPRRTTKSPWIWYRGRHTPYLSHLPVDAGSGYVAQVNKALDRFRMPGIGTGTCDGTLVVAMDRDLREDYPLSTADADCAGTTADRHYTPNLYENWRGIQQATEDVTWDFVEDKNYDTEIDIPLINPAVAFKLAGINYFDSTTTTVEVSGIEIESNVINFDSVAFPFLPIEVHYAVRRADGSWNAGFGLATSNTQLTAGTKNGPEDSIADSTTFTQALDEGKELVLSLGWTAWERREFQRMFAVTQFLPDPDGLGGVILPPAPVDFAGSGCTGVGRYERRLPSTTYLTARKPQQTIPWQTERGWYRPGDEAFVTGELARYWGTTFTDVSITDSGGGRMTDPTDPLVLYFDRFYVGPFKRSIQNVIDEQLRGRATGGTTTQLRCAGKDWFNPIWHAGGVVRTETGTATGGSTTTLVDTSKITGAGPGACYWAADRFANFTGSYVGFVVEVLMSGATFSDPDAVIERRLITAGDPTTGTLTWAEPLSASASGKDYQIDEPFSPHRFEGRQVKLSRPKNDGSGYDVATATIAGNDDDGLYFTAANAWAIDEKTDFEIIEPPFGVYQWDGAKWVKPSGADAARDGASTPADFHPVVNENLPTYVKRYGKFCYRDAVCRRLFDEFASMMAVLRATRASIDWTANGEDNRKGSIVAGNLEGYAGTWTDVQDDAAATWGIATPINDPNPPEAWARGKVSLVPSPDTGKEIETEARYSYAMAHVPQPHCPIANTVDFYAKAQIDGTDTDEGSGCINDDLGGGDIRHIWTRHHFNANGADVLYRQIKKWGSVGPSTVEDKLSPALGSIAAPATVDEPSPGGCFTPTTDNGLTDDYREEVYEGYVIPGGAGHLYGVVKWEFDDL